MNSFTIKDLESLSGIKAHTIRIWEQRYSFLKPMRTDTNIRCYTCKELKTVLNIALLNKYGFRISHIDKMDEEEINRKLVSLTDVQALQEKMVNELIGYMIDLNDDLFELAIDKFIRTKGIERAIGQLIFPFLERIGILWQTNHINAAQEHIVTNIIRQKLIVGIENAGSIANIDQSVLLFLPEGEHHELGLLYIYYLLRGRGVRVIYLGCDVPQKDVAYIAGCKTPNYIYSHITCVPSNTRLEKYLSQLRNDTKGIPIIISGQLAQNPGKHRIRGLQFKRSLPEVLEFVASL